MYHASDIRFILFYFVYCSFEMLLNSCEIFLSTINTRKIQVIFRCEFKFNRCVDPIKAA